MEHIPLSGWSAVVAMLVPLMVAVIRRPHWKSEAVELLSFAVTTALYVLSLALEGKLSYPLDAEFAVGLLAVLGGAKLSRGLLWNTQRIGHLEQRDIFKRT